jgi:hypothetical protein
MYLLLAVIRVLCTQLITVRQRGLRPWELYESVYFLVYLPSVKLSIPCSLLGRERSN